MRKILSLVILTISVALLAACGGANGGSGSAKGRAVFSVSDAAADMGAVSEVRVTIDSVRVRGEAGAWTTVSTETQTFNLLELRDRGAAELLAEADLEAGAYDRIELSVSKATVVDQRGEHEAKLPSNKLRLEGKLEVEEDATAAANFDFLVDQSLHLSGEGRYVLAPVILLEARKNARVEIASNKEVRVEGGSTTTSYEVGMDVHGNMDAGLRIAPDAALTLSASGGVVQTKGQALLSGTVKAVDLATGVVTVRMQTGVDVTLHLASDSNVKIDGSTKQAAGLGAAVGLPVSVEYNAATKSIAELSASADAEARSEVGGGLSTSGTIQSVDAAKSTVTVKTNAGTEVTLKVAEQSTIDGIELGGSLLSGLLRLSSNNGATVDVIYDAKTKTVTRMEGGAQAKAGANVTGTLKAVDRLSGKITVTADSGEEIILALPSKANVVVDGSTATMAELATKIGAQVKADYNAESRVADSVEAEGEARSDASAKGEVGAQATASVTGTLEGVNTLSGTITVAGESGARLVLKIGSTTKLATDGVTATLAGLGTKIGSKVSVSYDAETKVASLVEVQSGGEAGVESTVTGSLAAVNPLAGTITVVTESGAELVLDVSSSTKLLVEGSVATMASLVAHVGSHVKVTYDARTKVASSVETTDSVSASGGANGSGNVDASESISGTVKAVDLVAGTVTVVSMGAEYVLQVTSDTKVMVDGAGASLEELANLIGSSMTAEFDARTRTAASIKIGN